MTRAQPTLARWGAVVGSLAGVATAAVLTTGPRAESSSTRPGAALRTVASMKFVSPMKLATNRVRGRR